MSELWETIDGNWSSVRAVAATRHAMFVLHEDSHLYRIDPIAGEYIESIDRGFVGNHMVAHGERLFIFDDSGTLFRVDPTAVTCEQLPEPWHDVRAVASCGNRIYAVAERALYAIDPDNGAYQRLAFEWDTRHLLGYRDQLFAWEPDRHIYRVDPRDGGYTRLDGEWPNTTGVATACGRMFAVDDGILYEITADGGYATVSDRMRTRFLVGLHSCLYSFCDNGDLYRIAVG